MQKSERDIIMVTVMKKAFIELQNGGHWKGPLDIICPTCLPEQVHSEQAAQEHIQAGCETLQSFSGQTLLGLQCTFTGKKFILMFR